jgi:hypothetical protein
MALENIYSNGANIKPVFQRFKCKATNKRQCNINNNNNNNDIREMLPHNRRNIIKKIATYIYHLWK